MTVTREQVIKEAKSWLRTPYHHMAKVKGDFGGADCATLLAGVFENVGMVDPVEIEHYPEQWHFNQSAERFLEKLKSYCDQVEVPEPGDIVLFKLGRVYSHGGIVISWPTIIHARYNRTVEYCDADKDPHLSRVEKNFFSPWRAR